MLNFWYSPVIKIKKQIPVNFNAESIKNQASQGNRKAKSIAKRAFPICMLQQNKRRERKMDLFGEWSTDPKESSESEGRSGEAKIDNVDASTVLICVCEREVIKNEDNGLFAIYLHICK